MVFGRMSGSEKRFLVVMASIALTHGAVKVAGHLALPRRGALSVHGVMQVARKKAMTFLRTFQIANNADMLT